MSYPVVQLQAHYRQMVTIRRFEEALSGLFSKGLIGGTSHFCIGQEATAVGATAALQPDDMVTSNHRGHGHFIAKGCDVGRMMAELMGRQDGYSAGRGGSQHMADFSIGFLGSNGITAGMIPVATGAALTQKIKSTGRVVLCFFGDGACGQGAFHEGINMGAAWKLPVVYFIENNLYAMSTPMCSSFHSQQLAQFATGYGIPGVTIDGNDYFAVRAATEEAVTRARSGEGPTLIEALTYRMCGHSKSDTCEYRTDEEEQAWAARDPLDTMKEQMLRLGAVDPATARTIECEAEDAVRAAVEFAQRSPEPVASNAGEGLFTHMG